MRSFILAVFILIAVAVGWLGSTIIPPQSLLVTHTPLPTATRRTVNAAHTPTAQYVSCDLDLQRLCGELAELFTEAMNETMPLCRVKTDEWCVEQLVDLGKRARNLSTSSCGLAARDAAARVFSNMAMARGMELGGERDEILAQSEAALAQYQEACRQ